MEISSLVQGGQILHQARLAILGHSGKTILWGTAVIPTSHHEVVPNLYTTGLTAVLCFSDRDGKNRRGGFDWFNIGLIGLMGKTGKIKISVGG